MNRAVPIGGEYLLNPTLAGWSAPANALSLGQGPLQLVGVFDTRPDEKPWDVDAHQALAPLPMPGGAVLRWNFPRETVFETSDPIDTGPGPRYGMGLVLYLGAFDRPPSDAAWQSVQNYPGTWPASDPSDYNGSWPARLWDGLQALRGRPANTLASPERVYPQRFLARNFARPALDLLGYAGLPLAEADLLELGGGGRYIVAALRFHWSRWNGVDPLTTMNWRIPWTVTPGRAVAAQHRQVWHCSYPMTSETCATTTISDVLALGQRLCIAAPYGGDWSFAACHNGAAGAADLALVFQFRAGGSAGYTSVFAVESGNENSSTYQGLQQPNACALYLGDWGGGADRAAALVGVAVRR